MGLADVGNLICCCLACFCIAPGCRQQVQGIKKGSKADMDHAIGSGRSPSRRLSSFDNRVPPDPAMLDNSVITSVNPSRHVG